MRLIAVLLLLCSYAQAQDIITAIQQKAPVELCTDKDFIFYAKENARHIVVAYNNNPEDVQEVVDAIDDSWFNDMDLFISEDMASALEYIQDCDNAYFLTHSGKVLIDVTETYNLCVVTIYTIP